MIIPSAEQVMAQRRTWFESQAATTAQSFASLFGQTIVVTGASGGLGRAITAEALRAGAFVIGADRGESDGAHVASAAGAAASAAPEAAGFVSVRADLREPHDVRRLAALAEEVGANALVNNAGIMAEKTLADTDEELWEATLEVNLTAAYRMTRALLPVLQRSTPASVVNISSQLAYTGGATLTAYGASKAGLIGFTRSVAREVGPQVRVNAVAPGPVASPMTEAHMTPEWLARKTASLIAGRLGEAHEIGSVVRFLLSDASQFIYGQTISVNGGGYLA